MPLDGHPLNGQVHLPKFTVEAARSGAITNLQLATLARDVQWTLDDLAFKLPTRTYDNTYVQDTIKKLEVFTKHLRNRIVVAEPEEDPTAG